MLKLTITRSKLNIVCNVASEKLTSSFGLLIYMTFIKFHFEWCIVLLFIKGGSDVCEKDNQSTSPRIYISSLENLSVKINNDPLDFGWRGRHRDELKHCTSSTG